MIEFRRGDVVLVSFPFVSPATPNASDGRLWWFNPIGITAAGQP
jgi:hypothetical protein